MVNFHFFDMNLAKPILVKHKINSLFVFPAIKKSDLIVLKKKLLI